MQTDISPRQPSDISESAKKIRKDCQAPMKSNNKKILRIVVSISDDQHLALFIWSRVPETTLPLETTLQSVYMEL